MELDAHDGDEPLTGIPSTFNMDLSELTPDTAGAPLARVRYGLGKELRLFPDTLVVALTDQREEIEYPLANIKRLILAPGEHTPSKLVVMLDLDDDSTVVATDGMTNARDFRKWLAVLQEVRPEIELDPPDMSEQLRQAMEIRRRSLIGCYGSVVAFFLLIWVVYMVVAFIGAHGPH